MLIRAITQETGINQSYITEILKILEKEIHRHLAETKTEEDTEIHLIEGLKLFAKFVPSHSGKNPKNRKDIVISDKIKIRCKFTDSLKKKINSI